MRDAIRAVPDGTYRHALVMDGYAETLADRTVREVPVTLACAVTVHGDTLSVDFEGTSPEAPRGINVVMNYTEAYTTFGIKCALAPDVPNNEGSFRPVTITAPPGSMIVPVSVPRSPWANSAAASSSAQTASLSKRIDSP